MIVKHKYNVTWLPFTSTDDFQSLKPDIVYHKTQNREKRCYKIKKPLFCKLKLRHVYYIMNIFFVLFKLKSDRKIISNYLFYNLYIILIFNFSLIYFIEVWFWNEYRNIYAYASWYKQTYFCKRCNVCYDMKVCCSCFNFEKWNKNTTSILLLLLR